MVTYTIIKELTFGYSLQMINNHLHKIEICKRNNCKDFQ